jgi:hypothetical protein
MSGVEVRPESTPRPRARPAPGLYEPLDWTLLRAPVLPVEAYLALCDPPPTACDIVASLDDPIIRTAVAVASRDLLEAVLRNGSNPDRLERSASKLLRYLVRMSTRATPFGLFAGVGLAEVGESTNLRIQDAVPRTRARPDMAWLLAFVAQLEERSEIRRELCVQTNQAAWMCDDRVLLPERVPLDGRGGTGPVGIRATGAARRALSLARTPIRWGELAAALLSTPGATEQKVDDLLTELWRQTFLLTELRPPLSGPAPARHVEQTLGDIESARQDHARLVGLLDAMLAWDGLPMDARSSALQELRDQADAATPGFAGEQVQVDAALALHPASVARSVGETAARAVELLVPLRVPAAPQE